ncbi:MAG TPA: glucokinase, partial [Beijerinckiaceae bacterium]
FPYPVLICDIGGTNARFALADGPGAPARLLEVAKTAQFDGLPAAARSVLRELPAPPRSLIACGAGPVRGRSLALTNASWRIDGAATADSLGLEQGLLLNDFEAMALSLPNLRPADVRPIGTWRDQPGVRLALGPGTGLGIAALAEIDGRFVALPSEAGHIEFGPCAADEEKLWPHLERVQGRVTAETVVSGPGLERLHVARLASLGRPPQRLTAVEITRDGLREAGDARETLALLWRLTARFAGDMAITFLARGGVTLAGGVLPRIAQFLDEQTFRRAFEAKAPMDGLAREIGVRLVTAPQAVLQGMAAIAAAPDRFALDYATRLWR